jgi:hypothetical protein
MGLGLLRETNTAWQARFGSLWRFPPGGRGSGMLLERLL